MIGQKCIATCLIRSWPISRDVSGYMKLCRDVFLLDCNIFLLDDRDWWLEFWHKWTTIVMDVPIGRHASIAACIAWPRFTSATIKAASLLMSSPMHQKWCHLCWCRPPGTSNGDSQLWIETGIGSILYHPNLQPVHRGQWNSFGGKLWLKLSMHYYLKTRACVDNPANHALHEFGQTTRHLHAPRPNRRGGMTRASAPAIGLKVEAAMASAEIKTKLVCPLGTPSFPPGTHDYDPMRHELIDGVSKCVISREEAQAKFNEYREAQGSHDEVYTDGSKMNESGSSSNHQPPFPGWWDNLPPTVQKTARQQHHLCCWVGNQLYFIKELYDKSILYLHVILDYDSKILNFVEFQKKYHSKISFLNYYSLIHAIPVKYKENLCEANYLNKTEHHLKLNRIMTCSKKVVKLIYDSFISSTDSFPDKTYQKWKTILRITIPQDNFLEYIAAMYSCTTATKLKRILV